MTTLEKFLIARIEQLDHRKMMIPRYVERPHAFAGKKDFSLEDLPRIEIEIGEAKAALKAVREFKNQTK